jgi:hypothetical protein
LEENPAETLISHPRARTQQREMISMHDVIYIAYIIGCVITVRVANRTPIAQPLTFQVGDVTHLPDQRLTGLVELFFMILGG